MYNSFAIWHQRKNEDEEISGVELHFNLWQFSSQENDNTDCLDIGIKITKLSNFDSINVFLPFSLNKNKVRDLGERITKHEHLLTAIFNERHERGATIDKKLVKVTLYTEDNDTEDIFYIYFVNHGDLEVKTIDQGTTVKINTHYIAKHIQNYEKVYLRFRIDFKPKDIQNKILYQHSPKDSWLQSSTDTKQFIDFRLNEKRSLPSDIIEQCSNNFINIEKIHFFLMRELKDELNMSNPAEPKYRFLENHIWSDYFEEKQNLKDKLDHMLAYHWKITPNQEKKETNFKSLTNFFFNYC